MGPPRALDQAAAWAAAGHPLTVAVNLSATSLMDTDLPEQVAALIAARDLAPSVLVLEITEQALMVDRSRASAILTRLRDTGITIAVDDFGTGYSSLAYLRDLPIDELKLDRSFIFSMADDARAAAIVESTIALAHSLNLRMVAEGVESRAAFHGARPLRVRPGTGLLPLATATAGRARTVAGRTRRRPSPIPRILDVAGR